MITDSNYQKRYKRMCVPDPESLRPLLPRYTDKLQMRMPPRLQTTRPLPLHRHKRVYRSAMAVLATVREPNRLIYVQVRRRLREVLE